MNNPMPWLFDTFGIYLPLLFLLIAFIPIGIFLRRRVIAWVKQDPALEEKRWYMLGFYYLFFFLVVITILDQLE